MESGREKEREKKLLFFMWKKKKFNVLESFLTLTFMSWAMYIYFLVSFVCVIKKKWISHSVRIWYAHFTCSPLKTYRITSYEPFFFIFFIFSNAKMELNKCDTFDTDSFQMTEWKSRNLKKNPKTTTTNAKTMWKRRKSSKWNTMFFNIFWLFFVCFVFIIVIWHKINIGSH